MNHTGKAVETADIFIALEQNIWMNTSKKVRSGALVL